MNSLSDVLFKLGEKEESERLLERARAISEWVHGPSHPATARAVASLARIRYQETELEEANRLAQQALGMYSEALGSHHPEVALMLALVGAILHRGRSVQRIGVVLRPRSRHPAGSRSPEKLDLADVFLSLGAIKTVTGNDHEAVPLLRRALTIREGVLDRDHPDVTDARNRLQAAILRRQKSRTHPMLVRHPSLATADWPGAITGGALVDGPGPKGPSVATAGHDVRMPPPSCVFSG